ncbi:hypothetical protein D6D02_07283 [Aureobasidium pullulans]|uniref:BTB domain-containing protein n=1 Tax=Aureobasidium pullulans TaxID=5580 RepID=A0A4S8SIB4_AURPU|nr:hypothetical protein D6D29_09847 [Aureobasidium pullulans]THX28223.1 hypothetical protein D6D10_09252 [Aureobasidium pullulans]THY07260.1 hypothetical protein D6D02_07283 [Aureobasidium pullulans]THZ97245.1 hypothetical protein D6C82_06567 [Aureobasidium pullulans]
MTYDDVDDARIWRWWTLPDIVGRSSEMIQIQSQGNDGDKLYRATVHKELLCFYSTYYTAAIKGQFSESQKHSFIVELNYEQTRLFVTWLYSGRLEHQPDESNNGEDAYALYIFADQTDIIALRRTVMTFVIDSTAKNVREVYHCDFDEIIPQLPEQSQLRRFLLEEATAFWVDQTGNCVRELYDEIVNDEVLRGPLGNFFKQLLEGVSENIEMKKIGEKIIGFPENPCDFHEHTNEREWETSCHYRCTWYFEAKKPRPGYFKDRGA